MRLPTPMTAAILSPMKPTFRRPTLKRVRTAVRVTPPISRTAPPAVLRSTAPTILEPVRHGVSAPAPKWPSLLPNPYLDYTRILTPEGGIKIIYKDIDRRLRFTLLRVFLWSAATSLEGWILFSDAPPLNPFLALACLLTVAGINLFIVSKPIEAIYSVEIRPDCMILDDRDIFWLDNMEVAWPRFEPDDDGNQVLCGVYGNRFVEYLKVMWFDEIDRTPEVLAGHLDDAMRQLWTKPRQY